MKLKINRSRISVIIYWLIFIVLLGLFFTNDFGLVDIHKSAIITAVGVDFENEEVKVTAEVAMPQPSQSGENVKFTQVQGSGLTAADALNEINSKTGFYPKLQFCKLILIGDSVKEQELFRVMGCFYRKNYSELTAIVAMCQGKASDMLAMRSSVSEMTSEAITKVLSGEAEKSANCTTINLKEIAMAEYSASRACYMPFVEPNLQGTSKEGGNGENVGGEGGNGGTSQGGAQGGSSGSPQEGGGESAGGGAQSGASGSEQKQGQSMEFTARKTAIFREGRFKGILNEQETFALALLKHEIRLAVLACDAEGKHYTLGLKDIDNGVSLKINEGIPELTIKFNAKAQIQGIREIVDVSKPNKDDVVEQPVLNGAEEEIKNRLEKMIAICIEHDCDIIGARELLFKFNNKYFQVFKDDFLKRMKVNYNIEVKSLN